MSNLKQVIAGTLSSDANTRKAGTFHEHTHTRPCKSCRRFLTNHSIIIIIIIFV
jgi:hypothetical protein